MKQTNNFSTYFIISLTFFLLGFLTSLSLADSTFLSVGKTQKTSVESEKNKQIEKTNVKKQLELSKYWEVYNILKSQYYDIGEVSEQELLDSSIKGLVKGFGDKHTEYLSTKETTSFEEHLQGDFEGIGAVVNKTDYGVVLEMIFEGSGAKEAGLQKGDIVTKANNIDIVDMDLTEAIEKIKGPAGTKVTLEIIREGKFEPFSVEVTRKKIDIPSVEHKKLDNNIGYIKINTFGEHTANDVVKSLVELKDTKGLIIDLRNNGGGYLESAGAILSNFIETGKVVVTTKVKGGVIDDQVKSANTGNKYTGKIVVLINENSASASEITAGALKEYDKAILVGKKSYGKGSVQIPHYFKDGSMVKFTVAKWFTPKDKNIDKEGIHPDIEVDFTEEDFEKKYDRQLEVAKKVLEIFKQKDAKQLSIDSYKEKFSNDK
ncbi:S41 family peptidase [Candidatus Gracilibacteria bacterium]|nr:S41 family peptidase [Candidatus Gracilibacteria bacterium]